jgi:hypothetical protein
MVAAVHDLDRDPAFHAAKTTSGAEQPDMQLAPSDLQAFTGEQRGQAAHRSDALRWAGQEVVGCFDGPL